MHELSITESILEIALRHARAQNATRITDLHLAIGEWSSIVGESVQFYWDALTPGTIAEGSILHFRHVPVLLMCRDCGNEYQPTAEEFTCPKCGGTHATIKTGEEFRLESIDVDE
jgi:hydrogenase nickel incorporation protein HypA/HybF